MPRAREKTGGGLLGVKVLNFWKHGGNTSTFLFPLMPCLDGPDAFTQKLSWRLQLNRVQGSTPHRPSYPTSQVMSMRACVYGPQMRGGVGEWVWPRGCEEPRGSVKQLRTIPSQFDTSHWAAEMSSRTDGPEQITNNTQRYKTAETHRWRWLILQTEIWGRTTEKKKGGGQEDEEGRESRDTEEEEEEAEQEHQVRDRNMCFLLGTKNLLFRAKSITFS